MFSKSNVAPAAITRRVRLHPPSWSKVATAVLGATSAAVVCRTECVVTIPATLTQAIYWQANY